MTKEEAINIVQGARQYLTAGNPIYDTKKIDEAMSMAIEALSVVEDMNKYADRLWKIAYKRGKSEAEAVSRENYINTVGYVEWLEKLIVDSETFEWVCENTDREWCEKNCDYSSIQTECLRHMYRKNCKDYELATEQMEHDARYEPTYNPEDGSM